MPFNPDPRPGPVLCGVLLAVAGFAGMALAAIYLPFPLAVLVSFPSIFVAVFGVAMAVFA